MTGILGAVRGGLTLFLFSLNTLFWTLPLLLLQILKVSIPGRGWRRFWSGTQNGVGTAWVSFNNLTLRVLNPVRWTVLGLDSLVPDTWYLVVANHRSWVDILALQWALNGRVPFLKFFLKKELFWVPFLGLAWWCLDYPFLARSARASRDLETIRKAAQKFKLRPVSVMNFVEGTRFTSEKHAAQRSPYRHLLKPKAGGLTLILTEMGDSLQTLLDVTLVYGGGTPTLWSFLCGAVPEIRIHVRTRPVHAGLRGDFLGDKAFRREFTTWLNGVWTEKDEVFSNLLGDPPGSSSHHNVGMT